MKQIALNETEKEILIRALTHYMENFLMADRSTAEILLKALKKL